jgi:HEAT repeat protein
MMSRLAWGMVLWLALASCGKGDPSTEKYWDKLLGSSKKGPDALARIGDELKTDAQKQWGAKLVLKHFDRSQERAAAALGKLGVGDAAVVDRLIQALQSNDPGLMAKAADALRLVRGAKAAPDLIRVLESWTPKNPRDYTLVRQAAVKALGAFQDRSAVPALAKMVTDRSHGLIVNLQALEALAKIGDSRAVPALIQGLYLSCPEDKCSAMARVALNRVGKAAIPALLKVIRRQDAAIEKLAKEKKMSEGTVTAVPFIVLGDIGDASTARQLADELLSGKESFTRVNAISAIGYTGSPELAPKLIKAYDKALLEARTNILHALHRLGDPKSIPFLLKVMKKREDPNLLWTAGLAVSYLGGESELSAIEAVLKREKAVLPKMSGEDAAITRQGILYFTDFAARLRAAKGCADERCWAERLRSTDKQVRIKAARMLAFARDKGSAEKALLGAIADPVAEVREEIAFALSRVATSRATSDKLAEQAWADREKAGMKGPNLLYTLVAARIQGRYS